MKVYEINRNKNLLTIKSKKKSYTFDINKIEYFSYVKGNTSLIPIFSMGLIFFWHNTKETSSGTLIIGIIEKEYTIVKENKKSHCKTIKKYKIKNIKNLNEIINKILKNKYCYFASKPYHKYTEFHKKTLDGYEDGIVVK